MSEQFPDVDEATLERWRKADEFLNRMFPEVKKPPGHYVLPEWRLAELQGEDDLWNNE